MEIIRIFLVFTYLFLAGGKHEKLSSMLRVNDHILKGFLSHDVASGNVITPCNKVDNPLVVYRFSNVT